MSSINEKLTSYRLAQDGFSKVLEAVPAAAWDGPSTCAEWTVRDVAGHVIWGRRQLRAWALGLDYDEQGGPGTPHPGRLTGDDPVAAWREARDAADEALTEENLLHRTITMHGRGDVPLIGMVEILVVDTAVHTWDIGHPIGLDVRLDPRLVAEVGSWAREQKPPPSPGFFDAPLTPPEDADEQARMLAALGRRS